MHTNEADRGSVNLIPTNPNPSFRGVALSYETYVYVFYIQSFRLNMLGWTQGVCLSVCVSVCVSVSALQHKRLGRF